MTKVTEFTVAVCRVAEGAAGENTYLKEILEWLEDFHAPRGHQLH